MRPRQDLYACLAINHETQAQLSVGHVGVGEVAGACGCSVWVFDCAASSVCRRYLFST
eukprot:CCRYP_003537-RA/>CCRYP_003537-RA protein AED:0.57 eAED:1.00 QI:0/-1/0/1/-1/0/1/0/57